MDRLFGLDQPTSPDGLTLLRTFYDPVSISMAEEALRDEKILYVKKERGGGTAVRIITGFSRYGTDFFVAPADAERALELFAVLFDGAVGTDDADAEDTEDADAGDDENTDAEDGAAGKTTEKEGDA